MSGHSEKISGGARPSRPVFPFAAVVGQEEMKLALLLNVIAPSVGGVLVSGHRGTGKSTAVRAVADLLPPLRVVRGCRFNCDPQAHPDLCEECRASGRMNESSMSRAATFSCPDRSCRRST